MEIWLAAGLGTALSPTINTPESEGTGAGAWTASTTLSTTETTCGEFAAPAAVMRIVPKYWPAGRRAALIETVTVGVDAAPPFETPAAGVAISHPSAPESVCAEAVQFIGPWPTL